MNDIEYMHRALEYLRSGNYLLEIREMRRVAGADVEL
jgi:hypothetical protein